MEVLWYFSSQNKIKTYVILEMSCKINSLGGTKIPYFVHK